jgi:hypothetical protein
MELLMTPHDDLDPAVFAAYGWTATLTDAEIVERLVALNAERAKEEACGLIRWLRPEYQNPGSTQSHQRGLAVPTLNPRRKLPWPKALSERVKAVSAALSASGALVSPADIAARFSRARPADIAEILETLCTMGHAHRGKPKGTYLP